MNTFLISVAPFIVVVASIAIAFHTALMDEGVSE